MKLGKNVKNVLKEEFINNKRYGNFTPGKALKIYRELYGYSQNKLAQLTGLLAFADWGLADSVA
jgi:hypothetical protein